VPLAALFSVIAVGLAAVAVWAGAAGEWPIAAASAALAVWMGSLAAGALRRTRP
jgi:hypothetical protein